MVMRWGTLPSLPVLFPCPSTPNTTLFMVLTLLRTQTKQKKKSLSWKPAAADCDSF